MFRWLRNVATRPYMGLITAHFHLLPFTPTQACGRKKEVRRTVIIIKLTVNVYVKELFVGGWGEMEGAVAMRLWCVCGGGGERERG